jgi:hypothetical protein
MKTMIIGWVVQVAWGECEMYMKLIGEQEDNIAH